MLHVSRFITDMTKETLGSRNFEVWPMFLLSNMSFALKCTFLDLSLCKRTKLPENELMLI